MSSYKLLLQKQFSIQSKALRQKRNLTQEEMSEHLHITTRAYSDLERGRSCCSSMALLFFLLMLKSDELEDFLNRLRKQVKILEQKEVA